MPLNIDPPYYETRGSTFGELAYSYSHGRKGYPNAVFTLLEVPKNGVILELGCGTGLATKQLFENGFSSITATDIDPLMLAEAKKYCPEVHFQVASADALPFPNSSFDAVVAFGCFHWFCNEKAIHEIKRVMQPNGIFYIVNKKDVGSFRESFRQFLEKLEDHPFLEPKSNYKPIDDLKTCGFNVSANTFKVDELFTRDELLNYTKSLSLWTSLPIEKRSIYEPMLMKFIEDIVKEHNFVRNIEIQCLVARNEN